jgi:hypothetical protein
MNPSGVRAKKVEVNRKRKEFRIQRKAESKPMAFWETCTGIEF